MNNEKHKSICRFANIKNLVTEGISYRKHYQNNSNQFIKKNYKPDLGKEHTHPGSIHNLYLDKICEKYRK